MAMAPDRGDGSTHGRTSAYRPYFDSDGPEISDEVLPDQDERSAMRRRSAPRSKEEEMREVLARRAEDPTNFTLRGILVGLVVGVVICFSNVYFGLQTGWISGMAMPAALISFGFFKAISGYLKIPFSPVENVLVQSVAGSVGTMPLGCGFVGVIPALEYLLKPRENGPLHLGLGKLCLWAVGVALFGVVFAVPLRRQVIIREKLKFPSGSATALMIGVLHGEKDNAKLVHEAANGEENEIEEETTADIEEELGRRQSASRAELLEVFAPNPAREAGGTTDWRSKIRRMVIAFAFSGVYTITSYFIPQLHNIPFLGLPLARNWLWTLNPSPAYTGQGIIMGPATTTHMLLGAILGWGILSPLAKYKGWASGPVSSWETGSKGWIVWVSLAIMLADAIVGLGWLVLEQLILASRRYGPGIYQRLRNYRFRGFLHHFDIFQTRRGYTPLNTQEPSSSSVDESLPPPGTVPSKAAPSIGGDDTPELDAPPSHLIGPRTFFFWLVISLALYFAFIHLSFPTIITFSYSFLSLIFAIFLSVVGVRALGETDLNPVSGISKITQLIFSLIIDPSKNPNAITVNLLAGAVSEAGALQAGDLMQDLKAGHLLGAAPNAQFYAQVIGSLVGCILTACIYRLYTAVYTIPSGQFQMPTAFVWIFTARLVNGQGLPPKAAEAAAIAGAVYAVLTALRIYGRHTWWQKFVPSGIAVAVGMYNTPSFTMARFVGGLITGYWVHWRRKEESGVVVLASGLILGEGLISIVNLIMEALRVPHL